MANLLSGGTGTEQSAFWKRYNKDIVDVHGNITQFHLEM